MKVMLVCSAGMSTSLLVNKMNAAAKQLSIDADIIAIPEVDVKHNINNVDAVLLAPQVRFLLSKMKKDFEPLGVPIAVIDSINYGTMNGEAVIKQVLEMLGTN